MHISSAQANKYSCHQHKYYRHYSFILLASLIMFVIANGAAWAQLPPTNMGQFVHQPGDNQYTAQTQANRHSSTVPMSTPVGQPVAQPAASPVVTNYKPTPAAPKADISLLPIVADEPIKPAGFPPPAGPPGSA